MNTTSEHDLWDGIGAAQQLVARVDAWEALDSRAHPTTGCAVTLVDGSVGKALVPTGASVGQFEVPDLRDGDDRYGGLGVRRAVDAIRAFAAPRTISAAELERSLDGPSNVSLAISIALAKAVAASAGVPLWQVLDRSSEATLPCPMVNIFSGGRHAEGGVRVQDFLAIPTGAASFAEAMDTIWRIRAAAAALVEQRYGTLMSRLVADEGGLAVLAGDDAEPLELLAEAIERVGHPAAIALDIAATQIEDPAALEDTIADWCARYPIVSVEDPCLDDDWDGWRRLTARIGSVQLVGDDLFATDSDRVRRAASEGVANAVLVKPNQIGTLGRARGTLDVAKALGYRTIVSARSGDTEDDAIADLAVGWNAGQIKIGSIMRSERLAKYNRLLEIEACHGLPYAGWEQR